jgi:hypothetical protein
MLSLSPIAHFQNTRKEDAMALANAVRTSWMTSALTYSMASMALSGATKEELIGARQFMGIMMNLAEPIPAPPPPLPDKTLGQKPDEKK